MAIKSISGLVLYVLDLDKTAKFYEALGFRFGKRTNESMTAYINWFWCEFRLAGGRKIENDSAGISVQIAVDKTDDFYNELVKKGMKPDSQPVDQPTGRREFRLTDPDGYQLIFFEKK